MSFFAPGARPEEEGIPPPAGMTLDGAVTRVTKLCCRGPMGSGGDFSSGASVRSCWEASYLCSQLTWAPIVGGLPGHPEGSGVERGPRGNLWPTGLEFLTAVGGSRTDGAFTDPLFRAGGPSSLRAVCCKDPCPSSACLPLKSEACILLRPQGVGWGAHCWRWGFSPP